MLESSLGQGVFEPSFITHVYKRGVVADWIIAKGATALLVVESQWYNHSKVTWFVHLIVCLFSWLLISPEALSFGHGLNFRKKRAFVCRHGGCISGDGPVHGLHGPLANERGCWRGCWCSAGAGLFRGHWRAKELLATRRREMDQIDLCWRVTMIEQTRMRTGRHDSILSVWVQTPYKHIKRCNHKLDFSTRFKTLQKMGCPHTWFWRFSHKSFVACCAGNLWDLLRSILPILLLWQYDSRVLQTFVVSQTLSRWVHQNGKPQTTVILHDV